MNKGSKNQNSPDAEFAEEITSGDNSKGNKRNKAKHSKNDRTKLNEDAFRKNRD